MSILLNKTDIQNIESHEIQYKITTKVSNFFKKVSPAYGTYQINVFSIKNRKPVLSNSFLTSIVQSTSDISQTLAKTVEKVSIDITKSLKETAATSNIEKVKVEVFPVKDVKIFTDKSSFLDLAGSFSGPKDLAGNHDRYLQEK